MALIDNLVSYWKFDDNTGTIVADSVGSNNGSFSGTGPLWGTGKINSGGSFITNNYVNGGAGTNLQIVGNLTISAWVYMPDHSNYYGILAKYTDDTFMEYQLRSETTSGILRLFTRNSDNGTTAGSIPINAWTHIAVTNTGPTGSMTFYMNGTQDSATNTGKSYGTDTTAPLIIGNRSVGGFDPFFGKIDEVGIWNRALSGAEVGSIYNGGTGLQYPFTGGGVISFSGYRSLLAVGI